MPVIRIKKIKIRPRWLPWSWRKITGIAGLQSHAMKRDWQLVLNSRSIPFLLHIQGGIEHIYVPPMLEQAARTEIKSFIRENKKAGTPAPVFAPWKNSWAASLFFVPLLFFYGLTRGGQGHEDFFPPGASWQSLGRLDGIAMLLHQEWHRAFTALSLHASIAHLAGNIFFGAIFMIMLARLTGPGRAIFITILAGGLANAASVAAHDLDYASVGFSTALFGALGAIAGIMLWRANDRKKMFMPLAAALGLLAMLGTEGDNTDYAAHISGLLLGLCIGLGEGFRSGRGWPALPQSLAAIAGLAIIAGAWLMAF